MLASSFNVPKQDFVLGYVEDSNEDKLISIHIYCYIYIK